MKTITKTAGTNNDQFLKVYDNVMTAEECAITIDLADQFRIANRNSNYHTTSNQKGRIDDQMFLLNHRHNEPFKDKFQGWMHSSWDKYAREFKLKYDISDVLCPHYKIQKTETGGGFTAQHYEQSEGKGMSQRFAVWMIYLNDDFEGGETFFPYQDLTITPKTGSLVIWPANYTYPHHAIDNLKGTKWIATGWFRFRTQQIL